MISDQSRNEERFDQIFAKKELIVIDAYPGVATLDMLAKRGPSVTCATW